MPKEKEIEVYFVTEGKRKNPAQWERGWLTPVAQQRLTSGIHGMRRRARMARRNGSEVGRQISDVLVPLTPGMGEYFRSKS